MTVTVCIPMYNEAATVEKCAAQMYDKLSRLKSERGWDFELIFCDDGSTDGCRSIAQDAAKERPGMKVIGYGDNRGKGSAVKTAVLSSSGDAVLFTDCDLAYGVDVIEDAFSRIEGGAKIVIGSRNLTKDGYSGYSALRKAASRIYIKTLSAIGGFRLTDSQCGMKAFDGDTARKIFSYCECRGFAFDYEVILIAKALGVKIDEMPVKIINHGDSTVHVIRDSLSMIKDILKIKRRVSKLDFGA